MKRTKRLLLATCALTTGPLLLACHKDEPLPGNPKGSNYDEDSYVPPPGNPKGSLYDDHAYDAAAPGDAESASVAVDSGATRPTPKVLPLPGNPKGSHYDDGMLGPPKPAPKRDAGKPVKPVEKKRERDLGF